MNDAKNYYKQLLKITSGKQGLFHEWILKNGESFKGRELSKAEKEELKKFLSGTLFKPKHCYYNSQMIAAFSSVYKYYEGMATNKKIGMSFEHSWLVKDGQVYDPTWQDGVDYFGVHIPTDFFRKRMFKNAMSEACLIWYFAEVNGL